MKHLAVAVLLIMQAATPAPTKAAHDPIKVPAQLKPVASQSPVEAESKMVSAARDNATSTISRQPADENLGIQRKLAWFTGALAVFAFLQLVVMFVQSLIYRGQAREMRRQRHEMRRQRHVMYRQWKVMKNQISQMENSGRQTDELIRHAAAQAAALTVAAQAAKENAEAARINAMAAENGALAASINASAAKASADAYAVSERAWIQVVLSKPPMLWTEPGKQTLRGWVAPNVMNVGRTPAKITKIVVVPYVIRKPLGRIENMPPELPPEPVYRGKGAIGIERNAILAQSMGITPLTAEIPEEDVPEIIKRNRTLYVYGYVNYRDILDNAHETRFCQIYWVKSAPEDATPEGFMEAGNTPAAYTRST